MNKFTSVILLVIFSGCSVVGPGEKGVRITRGKLENTTLDSGWYIYFPFVTKVKSISTRVQKTETKTEAASKDMQKVTSTIAINWHVNPANVSQLYQHVGSIDDLIAQIINPAVSEVLKASTAQMTAEEILTRRIELKKHIDESLTARLKIYNILVDDISLVDLDFTKEFNHAVESKQIAEQAAKQAEYDAKRAIQEAKSEVNKARGEAEAALVKARAQSESQKLLKQTLTKDILHLEYLKRWDGKLPSVLTGNSNGVMLNIPNNSEGVKNENQ